MNRVKSRLRSGLTAVYRHIDRRSRLTIMTFHRVGGDSPISSALVRRHLECLSRDCEMVTPADLAEHGCPRRAAMVTVDDCHEDIYEHLFPAAQAVQVPFTICVPTDSFFRARWLWFDQFYWILEHARTGASAEVHGQQLVVGDARSASRVKSLLKRQLPEEREHSLAQLAGQLGCSPPSSPEGKYTSASSAQMREMLGSGLVDVCAHTVTHTIATVLPDDALRAELSRSKDELEHFCGREVVGFCYPNGEAGDFDARTTEAVRRAGHAFALTSVPGTNAVPPPHFHLKRVHAHEDIGILEKEIAGLGDLQRGMAGSAGSLASS